MVPQLSPLSLPRLPAGLFDLVVYQKRLAQPIQPIASYPSPPHTGAIVGLIPPLSHYSTISGPSEPHPTHGMRRHATQGHDMPSLSVQSASPASAQPHHDSVTVVAYLGPADCIHSAGGGWPSTT